MITLPETVLLALTKNRGNLDAPAGGHSGLCLDLGDESSESRPHASPKIFELDPDDYYAEYVGHTADGRQDFQTAPFELGGREFVALYRFDLTGNLVEARIEDLGPRATLDHEKRRAAQTYPGEG